MQPKSNTKFLLILLVLLVIFVIIMVLSWRPSSSTLPAAAPAGSSAVSTSAGSPGQAVGGGGLLVDLHRTYSAPIVSSHIQVDSPADDTVLASSSLTVKGEATSSWFFEASFPMTLVDGNGKTLSTGIAKAQGNWMTTSAPVAFVGTISYTGRPGGSIVYLVLRNDNPSGQASTSESISIPLVFK